MHIAIICPSFLPVPAVKGGAIETLIQTLIDENENRDNDVFITVFTSFDKDAYTVSKKYCKTKFIWIDKRTLRYKSSDFLIRVLRKVFRLRINHLDAQIIKKKMKRERFDKVIIEGNQIHALEISKFADKQKLYFHIHANIIQSSNEYNNEIVNACHQVITVSRFIKNQIIRFTKVPENRIAVLRNCTNIKAFNKCLRKNKRKKLRQYYGIKFSDIVILFAGRIIIEKGIIDLIKALNLLQIDMAFKLVIAGSFGSKFGVGDDNNSLKKRVAIYSQSINDKIIYTGFLNNDRMPSIYCISDIVIVPSRIEDAAPLVPIEAMASGLPLIVTNSGGMPEYVNENCAIIIDKNANLIQNIAMEIEKLIKDKELRKNMGESGRKHAKQYSSENYYRNLLRVISNNI